LKDSSVVGGCAMWHYKSELFQVDVGFDFLKSAWDWGADQN